jgi:hypothetical protein
MAKKPPKPEKKSITETEPGSWDRFKSAIHKIAPPKKAKIRLEAQKKK